MILPINVINPIDRLLGLGMLYKETIGINSKKNCKMEALFKNLGVYTVKYDGIQAQNCINLIQVQSTTP